MTQKGKAISNRELVVAALARLVVRQQTTLVVPNRRECLSDKTIDTGLAPQERRARTDWARQYRGYTGPSGPDQGANDDCNRESANFAHDGMTKGKSEPQEHTLGLKRASPNARDNTRAR